MINDILDSISNLARANLLTGHWDNIRNELRKTALNLKQTAEKHNYNFFSMTTNSLLWESFLNSEIYSRSNCELRAVERRKIDSLFQKIIIQKFK